MTTLEQIKKLPEWGQLSIQEKRFLKHNLTDPKKLIRVCLILERAEKKAKAAQRLRLTNEGVSDIP